MRGTRTRYTITIVCRKNKEDDIQQFIQYAVDEAPYGSLLYNIQVVSVRATRNQKGKKELK